MSKKSVILDDSEIDVVMDALESYIDELKDLYDIDSRDSFDFADKRVKQDISLMQSLGERLFSLRNGGTYNDFFNQ